MEQVFQNMQTTLEQYGPNIIFAIIILIVTWLVALLIKWVMSNGIDAIPFVDDANSKDPHNGSIGESIGSAGFWIVILIGLIMALEKLGMTDMAASIRGTVDQIFAYLPQVIGAILTFFVFFIVARVAKQATVASLSAMQADSAPERLGLTNGPVKLTSMLGSIVLALIMIPGAVAALNVLDIDAITQPTVAMLNEVTDAIPNIVVAGIVIGLFAIVAKFVTDLLTKILPNTGLDIAVRKTGLLSDADSTIVPSNLVAGLAGLFILLVGLIQGTQTLGFAPLNEALSIILDMGTRILFGGVIIFAGVFAANFVAKAISASGSGATDFAASAMKWIIVVLSVILGISRMGLDPTGTFITNAALILLVGTSIAGGIAFGLGGKEWAARQLEKWNR